jgi:hypothetical protein
VLCGDDAVPGLDRVMAVASVRLAGLRNAAVIFGPLVCSGPHQW